MMETLKETSKYVPKRMPPFPKLQKKADWPAFWHVMKHWLGKKKYSPGKIKNLQYVATADDFNNEKVFMAVSNALLLILRGDALAKFKCQGDS